MVNILSDWHHGGLYYSLHLLFEKRLGWKLYRPIGVDWHEKGYWRYSDNPNVVHQYLDVYNPYGELPAPEDGVYTMDWHEGRQHFPMRAIALQAFSRMDFDYIIPSVTTHDESFSRLRNEFHPGAAVVRQLGNVNDHADFSLIHDVMCSAPLQVPDGINSVFYHQEFSLEDYGPTPAPDTTTVKSFLHVQPQTVDYPLWLEVKKRMPGFTFRAHGALCDDGNLPSSEMPGAMGDASFVWHLKSWGDGFGHIIHNAAAMGKPLIVKRKYYDGLPGQMLMEDGVTCVDIGDDPDEDAAKIRKASDPDTYSRMSKNMARRFREVVDYDREFITLKAFLDRAS